NWPKAAAEGSPPPGPGARAVYRPLRKVCCQFWRSKDDRSAGNHNVGKGRPFGSDERNAVNCRQKTTTVQFRPRPMECFLACENHRGVRLWSKERQKSPDHRQREIRKK